jgi:flavodoxin I
MRDPGESLRAHAFPSAFQTLVQPMKTAIYYGTTTGNTKRVAEQLAETLGSGFELLDIIDAEPTDLLNYDTLILGIPTWHIGDMQDDWAVMLPKLAELDFTGKRVAFFGLGDCSGYPTTFGDAIGEAWEVFKARGADLIGIWPKTGYSFDESKGMYDNDHFLGLMVDEDGESHLTEERVQGWATKLKKELAGVTAN